jgi:hypothetical protein
MRTHGVHRCAVVLVLVLAAVACPSLALATTEPTSNAGPPVAELPPGGGSTVPGVGGMATCDDVGAGWSGFDVSNDFVSGWQWYRDGAEIVGETNPSYNVVQIDGGHSITCANQVTWDHTVASGDPSDTGQTALGLPSSALAIPVVAKPTNTVRPSISGAPFEQGSQADCQSGTWSDPYAAVVSFSWTRDGTPIALATDEFYTFDVADVGHSIRCVVQVENPGLTTPGTLTSDPAMSDPVVPTGPQPPGNVSPPTILESSLFVGDTADCDPGTWDDPGATFSYQWTSGATNVGTDSTSYVVQAADAGKALVCNVKATNGNGTSQAVPSASVTPVMPAAPANTVLPSIENTAPVYPGDDLFCDAGSWTGDDLSFGYAWKRNGSTTVGTNSDYTLVGADVGATITCEVTASNAAASLTKSSAEIPVSALAPAANTVPPTLDPAVTTGNTLYCDPGTWTGGQITFTYAWKRDASTLAETSGSYTTVGADQGHLITCVVTGDNSLHQPTDATSNPARVVAPGTPYPATRPSITPDAPARTETATCDEGFWANGPVTLSAVWLRDNVQVAAGASYVVTLADVGHALVCRVTGSVSGNPVGTYDSAAVTPVDLTTPANTAAPTIVAGGTYPGAVLNCEDGSWTGGALRFTYAWQRDGGAIPGAVLSAYVVAKADVGHVVRCVVTATNPVGHTAAPSAPTAAITALAVATFDAIPILSPSASLTAGSHVRCDEGTPSVPSRITYSWSVNGTAVTGEQAAIYVVRDADAGGMLRCMAVATDGAGSSAASTSAASAIAAAAAPAALGSPVIRNQGLTSPTVGDTLTCSSAFSQAPTTYAYVWKRGGTPIGGATHRVYDTVAADAGANLTCEVTAGNGHGSSAAAASGAAAVSALAVPTAAGTPTVSEAHPQPGMRVYCGDAAWTGIVDGELVRWLANDVAIAGERRPDYTVQPGDAGKTLTCEITAYNGAGPSTPHVSPGVAVTALTVPTADGGAQVYGLPMVTQTVTCGSPLWTGVVDSETIAWQLDGTPIAGQAARTYRPVVGDATHQLTCSVVATNGAGSSATIVSAPVIVEALTAPVPQDVPMGNGAAEPGSVLSCDPGFSPAPSSETFTFTRDDGTAVGHASTYTTTGTDVGHQLSCDVIGTNPAGSTEVIGAGSWVGVQQVPTPENLPGQVSADVTYHVGQTASCQPPFPVVGAVTTGAGWKLGAAAAVAGGDHLVTAGDIGGVLRCIGSGTNAAGTGMVSGQPIVTAAAAAPYGGEAMLSVDIGWVGDGIDCSTSPLDWSGTPPTAFTRTWLRDGTPIAGQAALHYVTVAGDANHAIACHAQGTNAVGPGETASPRPVWVLPASAPFLRTDLITSGGETPYPGQTIYCLGDSWGGGGVVRSYAWQRNGVTIAGEAGQTYIARAGDVGASIACVVTGTNALGMLPAVATPVAIVAAPPQVHAPVNLIAPAISGSAVVGSTLTCSHGSWSNLPTSFAVAWRRGAKLVAGANHDALKLTSADAGFAITCTVTATNNVGSTPKASAAVKAKTIKPVNTAAPKLGTLKVGKNATCSPGTWVGDPVIRFKYQWYRGSTPIKGATKATYKVTKKDKGKKLSCRVTAIDGAGSTTKATAAVKVK